MRFWSRWPLLLAACMTAFGCDGDETSQPIEVGLDGGADAARDAIASAPDARLDAGPDAAPTDAAPTDAAPTDAAPTDAADRGRVTADTRIVELVVTLDGAPAPGVRVVQGGTERVHFTDADGRLTAELDLDVVGDVMLVASHPRARQKMAWVFEGERLPLRIDLRTFDDTDNPAYRFQDPGEPRRRNTTAQCGHCHLTINDAWHGSAHEQAARNPVLHDLYAGTAAADDAEACAALGGRWALGREPGSGAPVERCFVGDGVLSTHNPQCAEGPCLDPPDAFGDCADCHAPAINGQLGGRDLLGATGLAYAHGVMCDVCHRVESVRPDAPPGVAGRLRLLRPNEPGPITLGAGGYLPITFGPSHDSPNPRMGSVQRDHYRDSTICLGCHQLDMPADPARWRGGRMPVQSTWDEWRDGALADAPCQSCHMPPEPGAANGSDLQMFPFAEVGIQGGWLRPPGSVRRHRWTGPRVDDTLPRLAAELRVAKMIDGERLTAQVTVRNLGAGHALPTGEPMRQMYVLVEAACDGTPLDAIDGDAVPAWGGAVAVRSAGDDWTVWPEARPGDVIRVVRRSGEWHDYEGFGRFGDEIAEDKGMPVEAVVGEATVLAVGEPIELDRPLPAGDVAYLTRDDALAGRAGFGFARVLVDADGRAMVPHFVAVDTQSDNRLLPGGRWTSSHVFAAACAAPVVRATLLYRAYPWWLRRERGWAAREIVMAEVVR